MGRPTRAIPAGVPSVWAVSHMDAAAAQRVIRKGLRYCADERRHIIAPYSLHHSRMNSETFIDDAFRLVTMLAPTPALSAALIREQLPEPDPIEAALEIARRRAEDDQWSKFQF